MATGAVGGFIFGGCVLFFVYCMRGPLKLGSHVHLSSIGVHSCGLKTSCCSGVFILTIFFLYFYIVYCRHRYSSYSEPVFDHQNY